MIFEPEQVEARGGRPLITVALEARDRPGPAYKHGVYDGDVVWIRMGPLLVARATVQIAWRGEFSMTKDIRDRTKGTEAFGRDSFWAGRPRVGYAVVAMLRDARFLPDAKLAGPRTYGYEWIVLESDRKLQTWLETREPEPKDAALVARFRQLSSAG